MGKYCIDNEMIVETSLPVKAKLVLGSLIERQLQFMPLDGIFDNVKIQIFETLPIIDVADIGVKHESLQPIFRGYWLSLLVSEDICVGHAISTPIGAREDEWRLEGIFSGDMGNLIFNGLKFVKDNFSYKNLCVLMLPSHHAYALVSEDKTEIQVVWANVPHCEDKQDSKPVSLNNFIKKLSMQERICDFECNFDHPIESDSNTIEKLKSDIIFSVGYMLAIQILILSLMKHFSLL